MVCMRCGLRTKTAKIQYKHKSPQKGPKTCDDRSIITAMLIRIYDPGFYFLPSGLLYLTAARRVSVSDSLVRKIQSVQNAAARLITGAQRCDHIAHVPN